MNNIEFESTNCNLCGSNENSQFLLREDLNISLPGMFMLVKCAKCGLIFLNPRPTVSQFNKLYPEDYDQYLYNKKNEKKIQYSYYKRLKFIKKYKKNGTLLDIGCATGDFLNYVNHHSDFDIIGIEPNQKAAKFASSKYNLEIINDRLENTEIEKNSFDVITLWNVIEHLDNPKKTLQKISNLLKPNGYLFFNTPILDSLDYFLFRNYWIGFEIPRHFYIFSTDTIQKLTSKTGLKIIDKKSFYGSHASFMSSFGFWMTKNIKSKQVRKFINKIIFSLFFRLLFSPLFFIVEKLNLASIPTFVCKEDNN